MWLRKHINRLNNWLSLRESTDPGTYVYMRGRLECLDPTLFKRLTLASACIAPLVVDLPTIKRYSNLFTGLLAHLQLQGDFDFESIGFHRHTTTVDSFFRDARGHTLDAVAEVHAFKSLGLQLLTHFESTATEGAGVSSAHARKLKTLLFNTAALANQLRIYSVK